MKRFLWSVALFLGSSPVLPAQLKEAPVFSKDVAPILYQHCASCHRAGQIAPMSLLSYEEVRPWAASIREKVATGAMPPLHSAAPAGRFSNDRRLSDAEKAVISRWVAGGAPKGDLKDLPPVPAFTDDWEIGKPDAVITMPEPYVVPARGTIAYQNVTMPTNFAEDKWIQAIEVRPGTRSVVHHILVFVVGTRQNQAYTQIVPQQPPRPQTAPSGQSTRKPESLIATTAPGTPRHEASRLPDDGEAFAGPTIGANAKAPAVERREQPIARACVRAQMSGMFRPPGVDEPGAGVDHVARPARGPGARTAKGRFPRPPRVQRPGRAPRREPPPRCARARSRR